MGQYSNKSYGSGYGFTHVDFSEVIDNLDDYGRSAREKIRFYLQQDGAPTLEQYMKNNAPWQDRTRTARKGLTAEVYQEGTIRGPHFNLGIQLYHTAYSRGFPYGNSLENGAYNPRTGRMNKPYPILEPTARLKGPDVIEEMRGLLDNISLVSLGSIWSEANKKIE